MRFTMASDDKKPLDLPSLVIAQPQTSSTPEKKSLKTKVVVAVTCVVVAILVLIAILVGIYMFIEAEKEIIKVSLQLKDGMQQDVSQNPNTNTVQFHIQQADQEAWIINDYNSDLKVMKIKTAFGTNCYVTPLNESSPTNLEKMKSPDAQQQVGVETVIYDNTGVPIKDTSFLSKTARDACSGISTYWLYSTCTQSSNTPRNTTDLSNNRMRRATYYVSRCGGYYFLSTCSYHGICSYYTCSSPNGCYTWSVTFDPPGTRTTCPVYKCTNSTPSGYSGCSQISP